MEKEYRYNEGGGFECRQLEGGKRVLKGRALVFNTRSGNMGWGKKVYEVIARDALLETDMTQVICKFNHDMNKVLGTSWAGTLRFEVNENGLDYEVDLPDTETGREVYELAKRGDLRGNSFEFIPNAKGMQIDRMEENGEEIIQVTVTRIDGLYDVAPVMRPAYPSTNGSVKISKRLADSLEAYTEIEDKPVRILRRKRIIV